MRCLQFKSRLPLIVAGALLCFSSTVVNAADVWTKIESPNFEFIGNALEADIRQVASRLERFRAVLRSVFPQLRSNSGKRTRVVVFKDSASFRMFKPKRSDGTPDEFIGGLYQAGEDVNYVAVTVEGDAKGAYGTIFHEYVHELLNTNLSATDAPPWLNEGLAEYFQTFRIIDDRSAAFGSVQSTHVELLKRGPLMPWDDFFRLDASALLQTGEHSRSMFYAQAWALIHFLVDRNNSPIGVASANPATPAVRVFDPKALVQDAAKLDRKIIDEGVRDFVEKRAAALGEVVVAADLGPVLPRASVLSQAVVDAHLGDLLYHLGNTVNAEPLVQNALKLEPGLPMANATLGLIRLRQRRFDDARRLLGLAAASADQKNHIVLFTYAYLLSRENMDEFGAVQNYPADTAAKMRAALRRSIAIEPNHAESYKLLAFVGVITGEDLDDALQAAQKALSLQPGNQEFSLVAAQLMLRKQRIREARSIAEALVRSPVNAYVKGEAENIVRAADAFNAADKIEPYLVDVRTGEQIKPIILQRRDLTDEEVARIDLEREISNLNRLIPRPKAGEGQVVGSIERIGCSNDSIQFSIAAAGNALRLTSANFDDLSVKVLLDGTHSFTFRCNAQFRDILAVFVFAPNQRPTPYSDGVLRSIAFVPKTFKLRSIAELEAERPIIIEGRAPTDLSANAKAAAAEQAEFDRQTRDTQIKNIEARLRQPEAGERRVIGVPEKFECVDGNFMLGLRSGGSLMGFKVETAKKFFVRSLTPETGIVEVGCRAILPAVNAVVTYREIADGKELVAVEFVPKVYRLP
ncbi:MAG TPA: tetratricopeptide repeat protein [Pyrinomonadaceae bacterium]|nr:tetratricopeptide repeat protein [Pyrinomonadaceae bacterium]